MIEKQEKPQDKEFHLEATKLKDKIASEYSDSIVQLAKILAYQRDDDMVLSNHIREAHNIIRKGTQKKKQIRQDLILLIGSAILGMGVQGFISELVNQTYRAIWMGVFALITISAMMMIFWSLLEKYRD
jgi:hypothetical protein